MSEIDENDLDDEMSTSDAIRAVLASSGEPMTGRQICDALGMQTWQERNRIFRIISAMENNGAGVQKTDDGRHMPIPGWAPKIKGRKQGFKMAAAMQPIPAVRTSDNKVADQILDYLRGEDDCDPLQLLRAAREEIMQLQFAARLALSSAENLAQHLRTVAA